ncbi:MAG: DeoR family transcriptional regulator [Treponema sp.]|nr:DeoR family transcriptional regulator [Treponema sp.]
MKTASLNTASQFAEKLRVTEKPIKRDLQYLTENGLIKRTAQIKKASRK